MNLPVQRSGHLRRARQAVVGWGTIAVGLACLAGSAVAGPAHSADAAVPVLSQGAARARFNVAATHSPRLEHLLAAGGSAAGTPGARVAGTASTAGLVKGVDVSSLQHPHGAAVDWAQVAGAGYRFVFVKATEGSYYVNPYYGADAAAARRAGLLVAGYHFAVPNNSPAVLQADLALDAAGDPATAGRTLPLIIDLEYDPYAGLDGTNECYGLSRSQMVAWISAFVAEARRRTGQLPVIYTIEDWWKTCTGGSSEFAADPLWVAWPGSSPRLPAGWTSWEYWQYTSTAKVPGIAVPADVSYFSAATPDAAVPGAQSGSAGSAAGLTLHALDAAAGQALTWSASGLPPGMAIDPASGRVAGMLPATPAAYPVTVTVTDAASHAQSAGFTWVVHGPVRLVWPGRQYAAAGAAVNLQLTAHDGLAGCSLRFAASGLPPGLSMSSCGQVTGFASRPGAYAVTVRAGDSAHPDLASVGFRWTVGRAPAVATGRLRLAVDDKCLAGLAGRSGTIAARVWTCRKSAGQLWTLGQDGTVRLGGKCLAAIDVSAGNAAVVMRACTGRGAQLWRQTAAGGLANAQTGFTLCLADPGASHANGTATAMAYCDGSAGQAWTLPPGPIAPDLRNRCLAAHPTSGGSPATIDLARCAATASQTWAIAPDGSIAVGHLCLKAAQPATPGEPVTLAACRTGTAQQWQPMPGTAGQTGSLIVNPSSGLCIVAAARPAAGSALALGNCVSGNPRLAWRTS